jgi:hypothetical protein
MAPKKKAPPRGAKTKKTAPKPPADNGEVVDLDAARRAKEAKRQRELRARTGNEYNKKYKKAEELALRALKARFPKAYANEMEKARAEVGLPPTKKKSNKQEG